VHLSQCPFPIRSTVDKRRPFCSRESAAFFRAVVAQSYLLILQGINRNSYMFLSFLLEPKWSQASSTNLPAEICLKSTRLRVASTHTERTDFWPEELQGYSQGWPKLQLSDWQEPDRVAKERRRDCVAESSALPFRRRERRSLPSATGKPQTRSRADVRA
jgi:hypothetical protein